MSNSLPLKKHNRLLFFAVLISMHICANFFTTDSLGGALLALASGKAERRQVHPLKLAASV